jgi:hypothetical protein
MSRATLVVATVALVSLPAPARAELRFSNLAIFLNDFDVTIQVVLLGAIPGSLYESLQTGIAAHVRFQVELWQYNRVLPDRRLTTRTIERHVTYNVLTKEYKVVSLKGELPHEPYLTKDLREAQRVVSELRAGNLAAASSLNPSDLYYVRVHADVSLGGVNTWLSRFAGEAEETDWVRSDLLTVMRSQ